MEKGATTVRNNGNSVRDVFAALSNTTRLQMVELLLDGERSVNDIASELHLHQSGASQHLAVLTRAGILAVEPRGAVRLYKIREPQIRAVLETTAQFCTGDAVPMRAAAAA